MKHKSGLWEGIRLDKLAIPRAKRWTTRHKLEDVVLSEQQVMEFFRPVVTGDYLETTQGFLVSKVNRYLSYDCRVVSSQFWIEKRHIMAVRVYVMSRKLVSVKGKTAYRATYTTAETLVEFENTWFYKHHMYKGTYFWTECRDDGVDILNRLRMMTALRFD